MKLNLYLNDQSMEMRSSLLSSRAVVFIFSTPSIKTFAVFNVNLTRIEPIISKELANIRARGVDTILPVAYG